MAEERPLITVTASTGFSVIHAYAETHYERVPWRRWLPLPVTQSWAHVRYRDDTTVSFVVERNRKRLAKRIVEHARWLFEKPGAMVFVQYVAPAPKSRTGGRR